MARWVGQFKKPDISFWRIGKSEFSKFPTALLCAGAVASQESAARSVAMGVVAAQAQSAILFA